ncbi:MAG: molybdopterin cofactor-binding domain-containing protein [Collinsella sp.]
MAGIAEVDVDKATGKVTVVDYAAAVDVCTVINEALARVQAEGGIAQGIGHALRVVELTIADACAPATL